ncbi:unnamed protein product [Closterium sp. Naga37s-1]|nr:unnamed protein product [Closterium sp. Naga37s-1]CAI6004627.1 unnamed protein product [Closterium sp. NIES-65]
MAAITSSAVVAPVAFKATVEASAASSKSVSFSGLKAGVATPNGFATKTVSNGSRVSCMKVWNPIGNPRFETLSYLPALTDDMIVKEIRYMLKNGWVPAIEFDASGVVYRENNSGPGYYDGRYWTMWKLPLFGCTDASQVLREINECKSSYPGCFIRVLGFDNVKQVQCMSFIVHKP